MIQYSRTLDTATSCHPVMAATLYVVAQNLQYAPIPPSSVLTTDSAYLLCCKQFCHEQADIVWESAV